MHLQKFVELCQLLCELNNEFCQFCIDDGSHSELYDFVEHNLLRKQAKHNQETIFLNLGKLIRS